MIDIESHITALKMKWIKNLVDENDANWKLIPRYFLREFGSNCLIFYCNLDTIKVINIVNVSEFYKDLLNIWIKTKHESTSYEVINFEGIRKQIIWGNKSIKLNKKYLFFNTWI